MSDTEPQEIAPVDVAPADGVLRTQDVIINLGSDPGAHRHAWASVSQDETGGHHLICSGCGMVGYGHGTVGDGFTEATDEERAAHAAATAPAGEALS